MNHTEKFNETVGILVKAYLDGTLAKGNCAACAVGNICAAFAGYKVVNGSRWDNEEQPCWQDLFVTHPNGLAYKQELIYKESDFDSDEVAARIGIGQIERTGYTVEELARVEFAFESAQSGHNDEARYAGLMAVVDVLADIHGIDLSTATAAKALFVK